jgi:uncharacterized protein
LLRAGVVGGVHVSTDPLSRRTALHSLALSFNAATFTPAATEVYVRKLRLLLDAGADPAVASAAGYNALHYMVMKGGPLEGIEQVLDARPDLRDVVHGQGTPPLWIAAYHGHDAVVRLLLARGASVAEPRFLVTVAERGHTECVRLVLQMGRCDANAVGRGGWCAAHTAAAAGHADVLRVLLANGGSVGQAVPRPPHCTPLHAAAWTGKLECIDVLLSAAADPSARDHLGCTPLMIAAAACQSAAVRRLLLAGSPREAATPAGLGLVSLAACGSLALVPSDSRVPTLRLLRDSGFNVNWCAVSGRGRSPLYNAAAAGCTAAVSTLLQLGADPNLGESVRQYRPIHAAAERGHLGCVAALLASGKCTAMDVAGNGMTPLSLAAARWHGPLVELLLEAGGDATAPLPSAGAAAAAEPVPLILGPPPPMPDLQLVGPPCDTHVLSLWRAGQEARRPVTAPRVLLGDESFGFGIGGGTNSDEAVEIGRDEGEDRRWWPHRVVHALASAGAWRRRRAVVVSCAAGMLHDEYL